jgi:hypothetical protein
MPKSCRICHHVKADDDFYDDPANADKRKHACKECLKAVERERYWANVERERARKRKTYRAERTVRR